MPDCCCAKNYQDSMPECHSVASAESCAPGCVYYPSGKPGGPGDSGCSVSNLILASVRRTFGDERLAHELAAEAIGSLRRNYGLLLATSTLHREIQGARNALHDVFFYLMLDADILASAVSFIFSIGLEMRFITSLLGEADDANIERYVPDDLLDRFIAIREWLDKTPVGDDGRAIVAGLEELLRSVVGKTPRDVLNVLQYSQ